MEQQHRAMIADGAFANAMDLCRRLLRNESSAQRVETAHLMLDRLRCNKRDSDDDVNALLRLLANFVPPTRELTEDALSLLLCCDHRVLVIHHLSKLAYQSQECVKLVVEAYLELLASDRSLLVPILGSLADLPLDAADKSAVLDATECLLDAAVEDDVPAVVQSLLSMVTPATAPRVAAKLRHECNRIASGTLCLALEVIGRFAVAGSCTLNALLGVMRQADTTTPFDVILLTHLMGRSTENEIAIKTTSFLAHRARLQRSVLRETLATLVQPEWRALLPSFVRFCSAMLAACFQDATKPSLTLRLVPLAVDCLGTLVGARTSVHEEALTLLFTLSSQPQKLLMLATSRTAQQTRGFLCWTVADAVARQLAALARCAGSVLAPYAHLFLDHLHSIAAAAAAATDSAQFGNYPPRILDVLCATMVALTQHERSNGGGVFSLVMITIQKQLVAHAGAASTLQLNRTSSSSRSSVSGATQVKQLLALFLAGHLLQSDMVLDARDRKSLVSWLLRLLATAATDETLQHAMRLVQSGMASDSDSSSTAGASSFLSSAKATADERSLCCSLMAQVFRKQHMTLRVRADVLAAQQQSSGGRVVVYDRPADDGSAPLVATTHLVADLVELARKVQLDVSAASKLQRADAVNAGGSSSIDTLDAFVDRAYAAKLRLLQQLYRSYVAFASPAHRDAVLDCGFALPAVYTQLVASNAQAVLAVEPRALDELVWVLVCSLDIAVAGANEIAAQLAASASSGATAAAGLHSRLATRIALCLDMRAQLTRAIAMQRRVLQARRDAVKATGTAAASSSSVDMERLERHCDAAERLVNGQSVREAEDPLSASLFGLALRTLCLFFAAMHEPLALAHELELLGVLSFHLQTDSDSSSGSESADTVSSSADTVASDSKRTVLLSREGNLTLTHLSARARELSKIVNAASASVNAAAASDSDDVSDDESDSASDSADATAAHSRSRDDATRELSMRSLVCLYSLFVQTLECSDDDGDASASATWRSAVVKLFAAGCGDQHVATSDGAHSHFEVFYKFLLHETLKAKHPRLACALVDVLAVLTARTRKQHAVSRLCMLMLQQPFPSSVSSIVLQLPERTSSKLLPGDTLPVQLLPLSATVLRGASPCSLAKYRCSLPQWRHLAFLVVGSWAFASNASNRAAVLGYYLDAMRSVVESAAQRPSHSSTASVSDDNDDDVGQQTSDDDDELQRASAVHAGEHLVLTSLTVDTFAFFFDAIVMCCVASLSCAAPRASRTGVGTSSSSNVLERESGSERESGPFNDICNVLAVTHNVLVLYVSAERTGFDLPAKTNVLVIRSASHVLKVTKHLLQRCIAWRAEQVGDDNWGALHHLDALVVTAQHLLRAMDDLLGSFQERAALKMQQSRRLLAATTSSARSSSGLGKGRWKHVLLAKTYGKQLRKRRWISKGESKLLPYFAHGIDELRDFIGRQTDVYNLTRTASTAASDEHDAARAWLPLGPSVDVDYFVRSGSVIQDELIHGNIRDWDRDVHWAWNDSVDGDSDDDDDDSVELDASDDDMDARRDAHTTVDNGRGTTAPDVAVTHTPLVRRKVRAADDDDVNTHAAAAKRPRSADATIRTRLH